MDFNDFDAIVTALENSVADTTNAIIAPAIEPDDGPTVTRLDHIAARSMGWLWPAWIPAGTLTILGGHVGDGKSTVIAAALTTGYALPDGTTVPLVNVLVLSSEDDPATVIRPRLDANNADPARIFIMDSADLDHDIARLRAIIDAHDIRLLVIDPLSSVLRRSDRASEGDIRTALRPLQKLGAETGIAVLGVMRVGKTGPTRHPAQRLVGSSAVPAIARSVIMIANATDAESQSDRAVLQVVKSNYSRPPEPVVLTMAENGTVTWLGPANATIDELAETATDRRLSSSERADAASFLSEYLAEKPLYAAWVLKQAKELGFSEITIRRAKKDLGITSFRQPESPWSWMWSLPGMEPRSTKRASRRTPKQDRT